MRKAVDFIKWTMTLGKEPQNFLGAKWIPGFLNRLPNKSKRKWALRFVSFSPHYFLEPDAPKYAGMKTDEYLEAAFAAITDSRVAIYDDMLKPHLEKSMKVLDYGCGPGFLSKAVAPHVEKVFACDISRGALACADIINGSENIDYLSVLDGDLEKVAKDSLDLVYSFAVVQHLTDEVFESVLKNCAAKLKPNGKLILHIQLEDEVWRTEDDWKSDESIAGRIKYRCGLHCFARTEEHHREMISKYGFADIEIKSAKDLASEEIEEINSQALLTCRLAA